MTDTGNEIARRVAWVTGAGKGIGRALANRLADEGWTVAVSARTADDLKRLEEECSSGRIHAFVLDITNPGQTLVTVDVIERRLGPLSLVILNAGTHIPMTVDNFSAETMRKLVDVNLMGTVNCMESVIPRFLERKAGHIAVVASLAGYRGLPTSAAYGATKAGLINMCEALKPELAVHQVRMTLINPGFVETPLTEKNDFPMPFLMPVDAAAESIMKGLNGKSFEVAFPWRFAWLMKLLRILPDRLFFAVTRRMLDT